MTLIQLFDYLTAHFLVVLAFFLFPPFMALFISFVAKGKGFESPWKYIYSILIFLVAIPGIFAATLLVYLFLFERQSVWQVNLLTQIIPIVSMVSTLWLVQRNVDLAYVPGFGRLSGLLGMISGLIFIMYISEHFRWVTFTYMPASTVLIGFVLVLLLMLWGWKRMSRP